jgi:flagellar biosynthesis protein FlhA
MLKLKKDEDRRKPLEEEQARKEDEKKRKTEDVSGLLQIDPIEIEIGVSLIPLVDVGQGGDLLDRIKMIRRSAVMDLGLIVPPVRIRDNMQINHNEYAILVKGFEVGRAKLMTDHFLAMNMGNIKEKIEGIEVSDPVFGTPALWISEKFRESAEMAGYMVVDPPSIIATHLTEAIKLHAHEILGKEELKEILKNVGKNYPLLVEELEATDLYKQGTVLRVLQNLLREGITIRNMVPIIETILDKGRVSQTISAEFLAEFCRIALSPVICKKHLHPDGTLPAITIDTGLEDLFRSHIQGNDYIGQHIVLDTATRNKVFESATKIINSLVEKDVFSFVVLVPFDIRRHVKKLFDHVLRNVSVLSIEEVTPGVKIKHLGVIEP